jgi:hypothetical protein
MENHDRLDEELTRIVRSVGRNIPPSIEERVRVAADSARVHPQKRRLGRRFSIITSLSGAAVVLSAILFIIPLFRHRAPVQIAEIRTEFVIADKNITIIFIQRPDFPVFVTAF